MNRKEFLRKLQLELYKLPRHEIDDAIAYYNEYFVEAGPDQEQEVIKELGTPSKIATQIKADYAVRQLESMEGGRVGRTESTAGYGSGDGYRAGTGSSAGSGNYTNGGKNEKTPGKLSAAWWVVIGIVGGIFAAPVAIPVAFALAALLIGLFIGIVALLFVCMVTAIVLIVLSIVAVIVGITLLATSAPLALLVIGMGLMGISLMALLTVGIVALTNVFYRFIARKRREGQEKRMKKREAKFQQRNQPQPEHQSQPENQPQPERQSQPENQPQPAATPALEPAPQREDAEKVSETETKKGGEENEQ